MGPLPFAFWKPVVGGAYSPMVLTPRLWLDASDASTLLDVSLAPVSSGASVVYWTDKSGNVNNAYQTVSGQPTRSVAYQNGKDAVFFDAASTQSMNFPGGVSPIAGASAGFVSMVVKRTVEDSYGPSDSCAPVAGWGTDGSADHYAWSDGTIYDGFCTTVRKVPGMKPVSLSSAQVVSIVSGPSDYRYRIAGSTLFSTATNTVGISSSPKLGKDPRYTAYFGGGIMEVVVLNYVPTDPQIAALESYLISKWGL